MGHKKHIANGDTTKRNCLAAGRVVRRKTGGGTLRPVSELEELQQFCDDDSEDIPELIVVKKAREDNQESNSREGDA